MRNIGMCCPFCSTSPRAVKSRVLSSLMKEITYQCQNPYCGYSFVARLEIARTLSVSSIVKPEIKVPLSQHINWSAINQLTLNLSPA
ncbi:ogr/Delta-like zinc finger family protein [Collimonas fungivorans]|uniref:ogr/Delta-like zinc finger family protein n=1 Tax=Collimonas fungivorans TaxID=158899 RepID=UPI003FA3D4AA